MIKSIIGSTICIVIGSCVGLLQLSHLDRFTSEKNALGEEIFLEETRNYRDSLTFYRQIPVFGFDNIRANTSFVSFLQYFGNDELRNRNGYRLSPEFFESIVENDPYYTEFYVFLTNSVSLSAAQPERSAELMNKGLASLEKHRLEDSFYVWRYKGVDELLFLDDAKSAEHSFRKAAEWASDSSLPESDLVSSISQQTADFLEQNPDSKAAQIGAWGSVLTTAVDDETRSRAVQGIQELGGEVVIDENGSVTVKYAQGEQNTES